MAQAKAIIEAGLEDDPFSPEMEEAIAMLKVIIEYDPDYAEPYLELARIYAERFQRLDFEAYGWGRYYMGYFLNRVEGVPERAITIMSKLNMDTSR